MRHFPLFLKVDNRRVAVIGNDDDAIAKARLLAKSNAIIEIYADKPEPSYAHYLEENKDRFTRYERLFCASDIDDEAHAPLAFVYLTEADTSLLSLLSKTSVPYCVIDDLKHSSFTTPAIIDRSPVTIALGTEGTAPVLARLLKQEFEERLPQSLGLIAQYAGKMREMVSKTLTPAQRRVFWKRYFSHPPSANTTQAVTKYAKSLMAEFKNQEKAPQQTLWFVSAGPGDPDLLTMQARRLLHDGDVILHDRLVSAEVLELCRREAEVIEVGKSAYGASWRQEDIHSLMIEKAKAGHKVIRLKSGDATIYGRLDEEIAALCEHDIPFQVAAGLTSAAAGASVMSASLTRRGRNSGTRILTGHDVNGFADYDWREMAKGLASAQFTAAIYMAIGASSYLAGRLLMHGAPSETYVTVAENISRTNERWLVTTLDNLSRDIAQSDIKGPAIMYLGLRPHAIQANSLNIHDASEVATDVKTSV
ncbi:MAG: siroheme synthase CysG [Candidatus Puniceispirillaceae bacterium]